MSSLLAALLLSALPASAQTDPAERGRGIDRRQHHQQQRIEQGVRSGDLTRREAGRLERQQDRIAEREQRYRADGHLSHAERARLHRDLDRSSRHIGHERHDGQRHQGQMQGNGQGNGHGPGHGGHAQPVSHGWGHPAHHAGVDQRQAHQAARIEQARRTGELTRHESRALWQEQRQIASVERAYRADGRLDAWERADLDRRLDASGRHIYHQSHDADRTWWVRD